MKKGSVSIDPAIHHRVLELVEAKIGEKVSLAKFEVKKKKKREKEKPLYRLPSRISVALPAPMCTASWPSGRIGPGRTF
jgi:hypothetical protein